MGQGFIGACALKNLGLYPSYKLQLVVRAISKLRDMEELRDKREDPSRTLQCLGVALRVALGLLCMLGQRVS